MVYLVMHLICHILIEDAGVVIVVKNTQRVVIFGAPHARQTFSTFQK